MEAADCALSNVWSFVRERVNVRPPRSARTLPHAILHSIVALRADEMDATGGHSLVRLTSAVGTIDAYASYALARTLSSQSRHFNCVMYHFKFSYAGSLFHRTISDRL